MSVIADVVRHQARNLYHALNRTSVSTPSLGSMTLDMTDVEIARHWLRKRADFEDEGIVREYEKEFARWNGSEHAYAFMSGRVALSACIHALGLQAGDEVILPGYTCVVVPNAFHYVGLQTVYSDIELDTFGLDVTQLEEKITSKTRAILVQHLYGLVCRDYEEILFLAEKHNLKVIEDCAHATGAEFKGRKVGNLAHLAFYSSEQSKVFTTMQGGLAVANDHELAWKLKEYYDSAPLPDHQWIRTQLHSTILDFYRFKHPQRWWLADIARLKYGSGMISTTSEEIDGIQPNHYGRRMPAPIAALGTNQLRKIDSYNQLRRDNAKRWDEWCEINNYTKPLVVPESIPVYLRYPVLVEPEKKKDTFWAVKHLGVTPGVWFVSNIHPSKRKIVGCPNADQAVKRCINFPCLME